MERLGLATLAVWHSLYAPTAINRSAARFMGWARGFAPIPQNGVRPAARSINPATASSAPFAVL